MKYILGILAILIAQNTLSACDANGCTGTPKEIFSNFYLTSISTAQVYFYVASDRDKLDCTLAEDRYMVLMGTHPLFKEIYSTLLAASAADKKVFVRIKNGSAKCEIAYVKYFM